MEKETNFIDLCVSIGKTLAKGCKALIRLIGKMLQLTYRYWWVVFTIMLLAAVASLYYTRPDNRIYKVNAIATINGPALQDVQKRYKSLSETRLDDRIAQQKLQTVLSLSDEECRGLGRFKTYYVIDNLNDGTADEVDFHDKSSGDDTVHVRMHDRLALQFCTKSPNSVPHIEKQIIKYLNEDPSFQSAYTEQKAHLMRQVEFEKTQIEKLDSLTSRFYQVGEMKQVEINHYDILLGRREVVLFLDEIEDFFDTKSRHDSRYTLCTAPVVLSSPFVVEVRPVNGPVKYLFFALLLGWLVGCCLAALIEKRKDITAFLRQ